MIGVPLPGIRFLSFALKVKGLTDGNFLFVWHHAAVNLNSNVKPDANAHQIKVWDAGLVTQLAEGLEVIPIQSCRICKLLLCLAQLLAKLRYRLRAAAGGRRVTVHHLQHTRVYQNTRQAHVTSAGTQLAGGCSQAPQ